MAEEQQQEINVETIRQAIAQEVKTAIASQQTHQQQVQQEPQDDTYYPHVEKFLDPYITKRVQERLQSVQLELATQNDYTKFYMEHPEARERQQAIEEWFKRAVDTGRPTSREYINDYLEGKNWRENREKIISDEIEKREQARIDASKAVDIGHGSLSVINTKQGPKSAYDATDEELEEALKGVTF